MVVKAIQMRDRAEVAQAVEQGTENPRVGSSTLSLGTTQLNPLLRQRVFFWATSSPRRFRSASHPPKPILDRPAEGPGRKRMPALTFIAGLVAAFQPKSGPIIWHDRAVALGPALNTDARPKRQRRILERRLRGASVVTRIPLK